MILLNVFYIYGWINNLLDKVDKYLGNGIFE